VPSLVELPRPGRIGFSAVNTIGMTADGPSFGPPGYEVNLLYIAGLISLTLGGGGALSIDRVLARRPVLERPNGHQQAA
jgi:putative oxidoreductase